HGSLARAGKVRSQTPKVEKQEKKKTPKGRAKKRIIYNPSSMSPLPQEASAESNITIQVPELSGTPHQRSKHDSGRFAGLHTTLSVTVFT
ncbi:3006_t:CDS:2, partial [Acaulospora colombiana]